MEGGDGIIADGYLRFSTPGEEPFLCTFEATSYESREELLYSSQKNELYWDSLAGAFLFSAICLIVVHSRGFYPVQEYGLLPAVLVGTITIICFFHFYRFLFRSISIGRYRYIYAVEQFKRYFADEQWIAFGEDVFPNQNDKYFRELKRQCLKLGIGLIIVNRELKCRFVATPSMHNVSMKKRESIKFQQSLPQRQKGGNYLKTLSGSIFYWLNPYRTIELFRYKKIPFHQFVLVCIAFLIIGYLLVFQWYNGPIKIIADQKAYNHKLEQQAKKAKKETAFYVIDTPLDPGEFEMQKEAAEKEIENLLLSRKSTDIIISDARKEAFVYYDCARFANYSGSYFIIQDTILFTLDETVKRIRKLKEYNMDATAIWRGCFRGHGTGYLIYFDEIYQDSTSRRADTEASYLKTFFGSGRIKSAVKVTKLDIK
jgi:hypothetical protein